MKLEDVKKLANLARIDMDEREMEEVAKDFDSILAYVGQVQEISDSSARQDLAENNKPEDYFSLNVMREDIVKNNRGENTEKIMKEMPDTKDGYLKVKQIL